MVMPVAPFFHIDIVILPTVIIGKTGRFRHLYGDKQRVSDRVTVKSALHIQIALKHAAVLCRVLGGPVDERIGVGALLLLSRRPFVLVKGNEVLVVRRFACFLIHKNIVKVVHALSLLCLLVFLLGLFVLRGFLLCGFALTAALIPRLSRLLLLLRPDAA